MAIGTTVSEARNRIVESTDEDILVLFDADMVFSPADVRVIVEALQKQPDLGALGAFYVKRDGSGTPVCGWKNGDGWVEPRGVDERVRRHLEAQEITYVDSFGGGLLAATREALNKVGKPWFEAAQKNGYFEGNDTYFCRRLQEEGFKPSIHFGVNLGHVGQGVYRYVEEAG